MTPEIRDFLKTFLAECSDWLSPIFKATERPRDLYRLLSWMGWNLEGLLETVPGNVITAANAAHNLFQAIENASNAINTTAATEEVHAAFIVATESLENLAAALLEGTLSSPSVTILQALAEDLLQLLVLFYLRRKYPQILVIGDVLGVVQEEIAEPIYLIDEADGELLRMPVWRITISLNNVVAAVEQTAERLLFPLLDPPPESLRLF